MKNFITILLAFILTTIGLQAQSISIDKVTNTYGLTINKTGIGLDINDGIGNRIGTKISGGKAVFQTYNDKPLIIRTNKDENKRIQIYNNNFSIGPPLFSSEIFGINNGRLKFRGSKSPGISSGIEFSNATGTALRGFVGMADNGNHLGFWGFGNNNWNVRMNVTNGFLGIGRINPEVRLHINGSMSVLGMGIPQENSIVYADNNGIVKSRSIEDIYTVSSADMIYKVGTNSIPNSDSYSLYYLSGSTGTPVFYADVYLPDKVTLSLLNVVYYDKDANRNLETCLHRTANDGSSQIDIGCVISSGPSSSNIKSAILINTNNIIDNDLYQYRIRLRVITNASILTNWSSDISFYKSSLIYKYQ